MSLLPPQLTKHTKGNFSAGVPALVNTSRGKNVLQRGSDGEKVNDLVWQYLWIWGAFSKLYHQRTDTAAPVDVPVKYIETMS